MTVHHLQSAMTVYIEHSSWLFASISITVTTLIAQILPREPGGPSRLKCRCVRLVVHADVRQLQ